jgi:hypothetical protein
MQFTNEISTEIILNFDRAVTAQVYAFRRIQVWDINFKKAEKWRRQSSSRVRNVAIVRH